MILALDTYTYLSLHVLLYTHVYNIMVFSPYLVYTLSDVNTESSCYRVGQLFIKVITLYYA